MKILTNYNFMKNQVENAVLHNVAGAPSDPATGQIYFDTGTNRAYCFNGTEWVAMDALGASMTGEDIVTAINASPSLIDNDNLSSGVNAAISNAHTHSNKTILDNTTASYTTAEESKLATIEENAKDDQDATEVPYDNTISSLESTNVKTAIDELDSEKVDKVSGKGLSTNDYTNADQTKLGTIEEGAEVNNISDVDAGNLTDAGDTALHYHSDDRDRANHTGTQPASTISDFDTEVANNSTVAANTSARHSHANKAILDAVEEAFTTILKNKLDGIASGANNYSLPVAGVSLGGVKSGTDITVDGSGNVSVNDDSHNHTIGNVDGLQSALDGKPSIAAAQGYADTAESNANDYTDTAVANLVESAPSTLDTLNELAAALGDDPNFATTITNEIALKTDKYSTTVGNGADTSIIVTHNLNSRDVVVQLRETSSPYAQVITDVEMTTLDTITLKFAVAPATDEYTVTVIG